MKSRSHYLIIIILKNKQLLLSLLPIVLLVGLLSYNIFAMEGAWLGAYSNQLILLISAVFTAVLGFLYFESTPLLSVLKAVYKNLYGVRTAILILVLVGALSASWLISGVIPAMVYYGLSFLTADIFLPSCVVIAALISLITGSSWTTSATVGLALIGIGVVLGIPKEMVAGAVISGGYFGDKISPLSDTTNLAPSMADTDIYTHIRYMFWTTVPSVLITLVVFVILGLNLETEGIVNLGSLQIDITDKFYITPYLFLIPLAVLVLILLFKSALLALFCGVVLGLVAAWIWQFDLIVDVDKSILSIVNSGIEIATDNELLKDLFVSGGIEKMWWTILLIISAMVFGGVMESFSLLKIITQALLSATKSVFGLFASTVASCLGINILTSDQYLAIVVPGKMFNKAYEEKGLAPENLSRTLEDSGTVTSVLIPWNTCGAYQSQVLGVDTLSYFVYAIFNIVSPLMTLTFAFFGIKIKKIVGKA